MIATRSVNRLGFDTPRIESPELPALPKSARDRGRHWSDTVFQAVLALKNQLAHRDAAVVSAAANSILELERTRMRHGKLVAGSESVSDAQIAIRIGGQPGARSDGRETGCRSEGRDRAEDGRASIRGTRL